MLEVVRTRVRQKSFAERVLLLLIERPFLYVLEMWDPEARLVDVGDLVAFLSLVKKTTAQRPLAVLDRSSL